MDKLNVKALALAGGVLWGFYMLTVGLTAMFGWGTGFVSVMASIYIGFKPTFLGAIIGAIWGFLDGAIAGALLAWIYNFAAKKT